MASIDMISSKKRLLFVVNVDWFFVSHRLPIAKALIAQGYEVHIATLITEKRETLEDAGLVVHDVKLKRGSTDILGLLSYCYSIFCLLQEIRPDLVHLITIKPVLLGGLAARVARVPSVVAAITGLGSMFNPSGRLSHIRLWLIVQLYKQALKQKKLHVIFQNPNDRSILQSKVGIDDRNISLILGSGVNLADYKPENKKNIRPIVLFASRLIEEKGVKDFVDAAEQLKVGCDLQPEPRFVLVGTPDAENPFAIKQTEIDSWVSSGLIEHWGYRSDMHDVLQSADIVTLPSYYGEGLPKILIEASASGKPVVTTDHPGCRDAIEDEKTGLLVPVKCPESLAKAIYRLLSDEVLRTQMGYKARCLAECKFDLDHVIQSHLEIYSHLIGQPD